MTIQCTTCRYLDIEPNETPCNHCGNFNMWETEEYRTVEELEKIKAEIYRHHNITCNLKCATCFLEYNCELRRKIDLLEDLAIIDNHIKELKGE